MARIIVLSSGVRELRNRLEAFPRTSARFFNLFLDRVSKRLVSSGQKRLWKGHGLRTGKLQGNIEARRFGPKNRLSGLESRIGVLGSKVAYASFVHDGHRLRNGKRWKGIPFMQQALDANRKMIERESQAAIAAIAKALSQK